MINQLRAVAGQIADYQTKHGFSDTELCKRYAGLGSTKTYKRILDAGDELEELNVERQLHNYQQAWALIEIALASADVEEPDYGDMRFVTATRLAVTDALQEQGNNRLVIVEGASGSGKSTIARCLQARWPNVTVFVEADECWKDSISTMLGALLRVADIRERHADGNEGNEGNDGRDVVLPASASERELKLLAWLNLRKRILIIDEAHHMGPRTANICKTIINKSPTVMVWLAIPTLLRRIETAAYEEVRQLTRNRLCERVRVEGPSVDETLTFLARRGVKWADDKQARACAKVLSEASVQYGNWGFVNLVARRCRRLCARGPMEQEQFAEAFRAAQKTR